MLIFLKERSVEFFFPFDLMLDLLSFNVFIKLFLIVLLQQVTDLLIYILQRQYDNPIIATGVSIARAGRRTASI